jgi:hypothetical protein
VLAFDRVLNTTVSSQRNLCELTYLQGILNLVALVICTVMMAYFWKRLAVATEEIDEAVQSAQDYSVVVDDPDIDANDPDEWYRYFSQFGEVASVTIALDNGKFLDALVEQRLNKLSSDLEAEKAGLKPNLDMPAADETPEEKVMRVWLKSELEKTTKNSSKVSHFWNQRTEAKKKQTTKFIQQCIKNDSYEVTRVFCIYEHESGQRNCLLKLSNGLVAAWFDLGNLAKEFKFRGTNVLCVNEAPEPTEVIWENLNNSPGSRRAAVFVAVNMLVCGAMYIAVVIVGYVSLNFGVLVTAGIISVIQEILPPFIRWTTNMLSIEYRSHVQLSLMNKTFLFDTMTTCFAIYIYSADTEQITELYLDQVQQVLLFDSFATPIFTFMQPVTALKRAFIAPRTDSQQMRENYFRGSPASLGESFAHLTSAVFLGLFYAALLPSGLFVTTLALVVAYWTSKHGLMRRWLRVPNFGLALLPTTLAQTYVSILFSFIMAGRFYAGWPFDEVCSDASFPSHIDNSTPAGGYYICSKRPEDLLWFATHDWMSPAQKDLVALYRLVALIFLLGLSAWWLSVGTMYSITALCFGHTAPIGEDQGTAYTTVDEIQGYIPYVSHELLETPLIACDRSIFHEEYLHFQAEYDLYDIFLQVKCEMFQSLGPEKAAERLQRLFSACKYYPTKDNPDPLDKVDAGDAGYGVLWVSIDEAVELPAVDLISGKSDPCIRMRYLQGNWQTKTCKKTLHPVFMEEFLVQITDLTQPITFTVHDVDYGTCKEILGVVKVEPTDAAVMHPDGGSWSATMPLLKAGKPRVHGGHNEPVEDGQKRGDLLLRFEWCPHEKPMQRFFEARMLGQVAGTAEGLEETSGTLEADDAKSQPAGASNGVRSSSEQEHEAEELLAQLEVGAHGHGHGHHHQPLAPGEWLRQGGGGGDPATPQAAPAAGPAAAPVSVSCARTLQLQEAEKKAAEERARAAEAKQAADVQARRRAGLEAMEAGRLRDIAEKAREAEIGSFMAAPVREHVCFLSHTSVGLMQVLRKAAATPRGDVNNEVTVGVGPTGISVSYVTYTARELARWDWAAIVNVEVRSFCLVQQLLPLPLPLLLPLPLPLPLLPLPLLLQLRTVCYYCILQSVCPAYHAPSPPFALLLLFCPANPPPPAPRTSAHATTLPARAVWPMRTGEVSRLDQAHVRGQGGRACLRSAPFPARAPRHGRPDDGDGTRGGGERCLPVGRAPLPEEPPGLLPQRRGAGGGGEGGHRGQERVGVGRAAEPDAGYKSGFRRRRRLATGLAEQGVDHGCRPVRGRAERAQDVQDPDLVSSLAGERRSCSCAG